MSGGSANVSSLGAFAFFRYPQFAFEYILWRAEAEEKSFAQFGTTFANINLEKKDEVEGYGVPKTTIV